MEGIIDASLQNLPNLVSMLGMFIQERRHQKNLSHQELYEFLDTHRFENLKRIILDTHGLEREIDIFLKAGQREILDELRVISQSLGKVASGMEIFGAVALAASPRIRLSEQALWMIRMLERAENHYPFMNIMNYSMGILLSIGGRTYEVDHPRFIREDFVDLLNVGFIRKHSENNEGEPVFGITRLGFDFVRTLPSLQPEEPKPAA